MGSRLKPKRTAKVESGLSGSPRRPPAKATSAEQLLYFYGITEKGVGRKVSAQGVDGLSSVEAIACDGLVCWISRVSRPEYGDRLPENMENLEWLASASVRHQGVVGEIAAKYSILPTRFGTVFLSEASLASHVRERKRSLRAALRRIAGTDEWGVKVFAVISSGPELQARSGTEYLRQKASALERGSRRELDPEIRSFAGALARVAVDTAPGGKVSGGQRDLEWQASFLLPRSQQKQWRAVLDHFAARWQKTRRIECTGPWPPYSFVSSNGI
jgi:hypothetical protein